MALPYIMGVGDLDPSCTKLLALFILERKTYRFNELDRHQRDAGINISRPTLIKHLKHLEEKELIIREKVDKQAITYRFNRTKWQDADEHVYERIVIEKLYQEEIDEFSKRPTDEQVAFVNNNMALIFLYVLREHIIARVNPESEFMAKINFILFGHMLTKTMNMILDSVDIKGKKYADECILNIDRYIQAYFKYLKSDSKDLEPGLYRIEVD